MSGKKVFLSLFSVLIIGLLANSGFAEEDKGMGIGDGLRNAADTFNGLFGFIPEILTLENVMGGNGAALFWVRFIIWIALFAGIYFGASFVFKQNLRIAVIVALAFSLLGATGIPKSALISIFQTYGVAASFIVWFVPIMAGMYISHIVGNRWVKAVIYLLLLILLGIVNKTLTSPEGFIDAGNWGSYLGLLWAVIFIAFLWNLFAAFGGQEKIAESGLGQKVGGDVGEWLKGGKKRKEEDKEEEEEDKEEEKKEKQEAQKEFRATVEEIKDIKTIYEKIQGQKKEVDKLLRSPPPPAAAGGPPNWVLVVTKHNDFIEVIKKELTEVKDLDEYVKAHAERLYESLRKRTTKKGVARDKAKLNRRIAHEVKEIYDRENLIEKMVNYATTKIEDTKDLSKIYGVWFGAPAPYGGIPPYPRVFPTDNESAVLGKVLDVMKKAYNYIVSVFNIEKKVLSEIK